MFPFSDAFLIGSNTWNNLVYCLRLQKISCSVSTSWTGTFSASTCVAPSSWHRCWKQLVSNRRCAAPRASPPTTSRWWVRDENLIWFITPVALLHCGAGEDPKIRGFFYGCGFNSSGMMLGGGCGEQLAQWIIQGRPELHMYAYDIRWDFEKWFHDGALRLNLTQGTPRQLIIGACCKADYFNTTFYLTFLKRGWKYF